MKKDNVTLKSYFETGDYPTEAQFIDLIDSFLNIEEKDAVTGITDNGDDTYTFQLLSGGSVTVNGAGIPDQIPIANIIGLQSALDSYVDLSNNQTVGGEKTWSDSHQFNGRIGISNFPFGPNRLGDAVFQSPDIDTQAINWKNDAQGTLAAIFMNPSGTVMTIKGFDDSVMVTDFTSIPGVEGTDPCESTIANTIEHTNGAIFINDQGVQHYPGASTPVADAFFQVLQNKGGGARKPYWFGFYDGTTYETIWEVDINGVVTFNQVTKGKDGVDPEDFVTKAQLDAMGGGNFVTTDTAQTITGAKTFNGNLNVSNVLFANIVSANFHEVKVTPLPTGTNNNGAGALLRAGSGFGEMVWLGKTGTGAMIFDNSNVTSARTYSLPNKSGTVALLDDIATTALFLRKDQNETTTGNISSTGAISADSIGAGPAYLGGTPHNKAVLGIASSNDGSIVELELYVNSETIFSDGKGVLNIKSNSNTDGVNSNPNAIPPTRRHMISGNGKGMMRFEDNWLRLNPQNDFSSGIYCSTGVFRTDGRIEVGQAGDKFLVTPAGAVIAEGSMTAPSFIQSSDKRLKKKIKPLKNRPIKVAWASFEMHGEKRCGVIAQELEKQHPEFVRTDEKGYKAVAYIDLLVAKNAELEARIEKLEKIIEKLA